MKKAVSKSLKVLIAIVALIAVVVIILLFVKPNQVEPLTGYSWMYISDNILVDSENPNHEADLNTLNTGLNKSRYNIMHGILEWKANASLKLATREETDPEDPNETVTVYDTTKAASFNPSAGEGQIKLRFVYDSVKEVEIEGETIKYDRALVFVHDSLNEIDTVTVYFYEDARMDNTSEDPALSTAYYEIYRVEMRIIATRLYTAANDILEARR